MPKSREDMQKYMAARRAAGSDIASADIPMPRSCKRRSDARKSLRCHALTYHPDCFPGGELFPDQEEQIADIQHAIKLGEDKALAAMRGGGKTTILRIAAEWAILHGHSRYCVLVGATSDDAKNNLEWIKEQLEFNDKLLEDFPEVCIPIRALEGSSRRCLGQTVDGQRTRIQWSLKKIRLPILPDKVQKRRNHSHCKGAFFEVRSIEGSLRGINTSGLRPDLVLLDDVETRESAQSDVATKKIITKIETDIKGQASQQVALTRLYVGTIMHDETVTARLTDPQRSPSWNGKRYCYMQQFPKDEKKWEEYVKLRQDGADGPKRARLYYKQNREAMDQGGQVAWSDGFDPQEYESAIEKYFACLADGELGLEYCACELQNDPSLLDDNSELKITREVLQKRLNNLGRGRIPVEADWVIVFADIHHAVRDGYLWWCAIAVARNYTTWLVDYNRFPENKTVGECYVGDSAEAKVRSALDDLEDMLMGKQWERDDGIVMDFEGCADSGAGQHQSAVFAFCRESQTRRWTPTKGENVKARDYNLVQKQDKNRGDHWRLHAEQAGKWKVRVTHFDSNYWKTFLLNRIHTPIGAPGALTIWGNDIRLHRDIVTHWTAEKRTTLHEVGTSVEYDQWTLKPNRLNHLFDCAVGALMRANALGATLPGMAPKRKRRRRRRRRAENE